MPCTARHTCWPAVANFAPVARPGTYPGQPEYNEWAQARIGPLYFFSNTAPGALNAFFAMAFDMMGMMGKVKELQEKMQQAQSELQFLTATGEAGGGLVRATANGERKLLKIEIDESLLTAQDRDMLADLVVAAANKALEAAGEQARQELQRKTSGLMPNIPGLDLGSFGV